MPIIAIMWLRRKFIIYCMSISQNVGLRALEHFLTSNSGLHHSQAQLVLDATRFCLERNYFLFDGEYYLHMWHSYRFKICTLLHIFMDDTYCTMSSFVDYFNNNPLCVSFSHVHDQEFLVLFGSGVRSHRFNNYLQKHIFFLKSAGNTYLHTKSCHHPNWVCNILLNYQIFLNFFWR